MPTRKLTLGEKTLLRSIFGATLPYDDQLIGTNDEEYGGRNNSITLAVVPHMAIPIWALDYSSPSVSDDDKWIFIHEMGHVWHWYHDGSNMLNGIWTAITHSSYEDAYDYDLSKHGNLTDFNFEAQASIIADYWYVLRGHPPQKNVGSKKDTRSYVPFIVQVQTAGTAKTGVPNDFVKNYGSSSKYKPY